MSDYCCAVIMGQVNSYTCYRPAKGVRAGFPACGIHLRPDTSVLFDDGENVKEVFRESVQHQETADGGS